LKEKLGGSPPEAPPLACERGCASDSFKNFDPPLDPYENLPPARPLQRSTAMIVPIQIMLVIMDDPPWLIKGRGMPTTGARPITIIILIAT